MDLARYFVFERGDRWIVALNGQTIRQCESREAALYSATVMADLMGSMRHEADVMVEDHGNLNLAWTFGADPLPEQGPRA